MKNPIKTYNTFEIVAIPFPFIDSSETKKRPAVIISSWDYFNKETDSCIMAMITTAKHSSWPGDVKITDLKKAGLPVESLIRMKLFTMDQRLILKKIGQLAQVDIKNLTTQLRKVIS